MSVQSIFRKSVIAVSIMQVIALNCSVNAKEYSNTVNLSDTTLNANDVIVTSDKDGIYGTSADQALNINNGGININVDSNKESAAGINLSNLSGNNIGSNSNITVVNGGGPHDKAGIGINLTTSGITADHLSIDVTSTNQAIGVNATDGSSVDLGTGSTITSASHNVSSAVYMAGGNQSFNANNIEMNSTSNVAFGMSVGSGNSTINLGSNSIIKANGGKTDGFAAGLNFSDNGKVDFDASGLKIIAEGKQAYGIRFENTSSGTDVNLGSNSTILVNAESGAGVYISENSDANFSASDLTIVASGQTNAIEAHNGSVSITGQSNIFSENGYSVFAGGKSNVSLNTTNGSNIQGDINAQEDGVVEINSAGTNIKGQATIDGNGQINVSLTDGSVWDALSDSTVTHLTLDHSDLYIAKDPSDLFKGNVFTVKGNYDGNGGTIHFDTVLGDDNSETDKLVIEGNTSGNTLVSVNNLGGHGADTINGIELITVAGDSAGEFKQSGRITAGAYDYYLDRGEGSNASNWYLTSRDTPHVRPEGGVYAGNIAAANNIFVNRLQDRLGETHYVDALTGENKVSSLWIRQEFGQNDFKDSTGQLKTDSDRYVLQLGGDIADWTTDQKDRFHLGLMAGYANQSSETVNKLSGNKAKGSVEGASVGIYGTWFQDNEQKTGLYLDGWAQYNWFNNSVFGDDIASERYKSKGVTASLESGYSALVKENEQTKYYIQPKAQVTWMGVKADNHVENNGTIVQSVGQDNIQTRLGLRAYLNHSPEQKDSITGYQPFVEANWIHNSKEFGVQMDDVVLNQDGARNIGEIKIGVEGQASKSTTVWGNVAYQMGSNDYSDAVAKLGVKFSF